MIQQPELGKKISDLRKEKGLTQEELVEKCNLSVRTLQRIEAGNVTPRPITVKLIFEALDVSFDKTMKNKGLALKWLEQFYISFIDLFNLKTNTMRKISILTVVLSGIVFGLFTFVIDGKAQDVNDKTADLKESNKMTTQSDSEMKAGNFSCEKCFYDDNDLIGYGVKFIQDGVSVNVHLLKLNTSTGKFYSGSLKGVLFKNKVEVEIPEIMLNKRIFYKADNIEKLNGKIVLKGDANLKFFKDESIEAEEIILFLE